ncbi:MAG: 30S ribosomal protein S12 methylthiotransferase RimO [Erysipelotrichaceae bacterium]|nr:30S ribosomal protein S12 methylthiotransferase RimO [Erysipelotrichaceae bacterium]
MKIGLVSLGCSKNLIDTQNALSFLKASGHVFVSDPKKADVIIVNTCGFIESAKQESINTILEMADYKQHRCKKLIAMGCLVQRYRRELEEELPEVDRFISIDEYRDMEKILNETLASETICQREIVLATEPYTSYLRIADGCSNHCTFCAIPLIRGRYTSVPFEEVLENARQLQAIGVKELNIIAQDSTMYGKDLYGRLRLHELLIELNKMDFHWIRVLYMYPDEIYDGLLDSMASLKKVIPYFDIPSQHGSDRILKLMNRRGRKQDIQKTVRDIREKFADPILRTTVIVGFPSETDEDFRQLMDLTEEIRWDRLGAFAYSREEGTGACRLPDQVDEKTAQKRLDELMQRQSQISLENNQRYEERTIEVLVERKKSFNSPYYQGRGWMHAPDDIDGHVFFRSDQALEPGQFVEVEIERAEMYDLFGREKRKEG